MTREDIIKKYKEKILSQDSWGPCAEQYVDEYIKEEELNSILWTIADGETRFTLDGINFLKEYYGGLDVVAEMGEKKGGFGSGLEKKGDILNWLERIEKEEREYEKAKNN